MSRTGDGRTRRYPLVQFKKDTWEIDEFDVASMYLLVGKEKAMLIDCGMGLGVGLAAVGAEALGLLEDSLVAQTRCRCGSDS